jgi:OFA family oxalate/formate antiporter-like MFS transporter
MKRYLVLLASIVIQACLGGIYAWSAFAPALHEVHGLPMARIQLTFGMCVTSFTLVMVLAGRLQQSLGPRIVAAIGGVLFGCGYVLASFCGGRFWLFLAGAGVVAGAGIACGYICPIATCIRWFPQRKGLVTGLAVAGFGGGAVVLSAIASALFARGFDVLEIFRWVGLSYGCAIVVAACFLFVPDEPMHASRSEETPMVPLLAGRDFRMLFAGMFAGTFAGLLTIGNLKPIGLAGGISPGLATMAISSLAIGNACGRVIWGWVSDRIQGHAIPLSLGFLSLSVLALMVAGDFGGGFVAAAFLIGFGYGACFVLYAAAVARLFGPAAVGRTYPLVFLSYGVSGTLGPATGGWLFDLTQSYWSALVVAAALPGIGSVVYAMFGRRP